MYVHFSISGHQRNPRKSEMKKVDAFIYLEVLFFDLLPHFILFGNSYYERTKTLGDMKSLFKVYFITCFTNTCTWQSVSSFNHLAYFGAIEFYLAYFGVIEFQLYNRCDLYWFVLVYIN